MNIFKKIFKLKWRVRLLKEGIFLIIFAFNSFSKAFLIVGEENDSEKCVYFIWLPIFFATFLNTSLKQCLSAYGAYLEGITSILPY